jgi:hypothetical protein
MPGPAGGWPRPGWCSAGLQLKIVALNKKTPLPEGKGALIF